MKVVQLNCRVSVDLIKRFVAACKRMRLPQYVALEQAIKEWLSKNDK